MFFSETTCLKLLLRSLEIATRLGLNDGESKAFIEIVASSEWIQWEISAIF